jgi:uncharacterized secreted protein with C-terminal beta-propeller domain
MKKNLMVLFSVLIVLISIFSSCSKSGDSTTDPRNQFVGKWIGTKTFTFTQFPNLNKTVPDTLVITLAAGSSTNISVESSGYSETASVSGNTFTYNQYEINITLGITQYALTINGSVTLSGNKLDGAGEFSASSAGSSSTGGWTNSLTKQ